MQQERYPRAANKSRWHWFHRKGQHKAGAKRVRSIAIFAQSDICGEASGKSFDGVVYFLSPDDNVLLFRDADIGVSFVEAGF